MICGTCAAENPSTHRFCHACGSALTPACAGCGAELVEGHAFCGTCGMRHDAVAAPTVASAVPESVDERRHVSVLFVDLVGFTTLSEDRDPEAVRELLSTYFDHARTIVARYGGTIEKFIGDAVMAVWGTPVALADDAERAVRAGLDLVDAVAAMDEGVPGAPLAARAGVVSGEAAVKLDAVHQGMVAGDVVNTAARVQSAAEPGAVLVDEATRAATSSSIDYRDAGEHLLKGKAEPVRLHRAAEVVAGTGGALRFDGLEAPFLGRDRELRMVKELFHDSAEQSRTRLVLVSGAAGVGKSRIGWEFFKYLDGISQFTWWHVGRCESFGDGLAYGAFVDMVRTRLKVEEGDLDATILDKLRAGLDEFVADPEERQWLLPRLAVLLGVADRLPDGSSAVSGESLFGGWRLFLERLAEQEPVVLVFEDFQNADDGLLEFVQHLLDWSTGVPIFILALTRPELLDERHDLLGHRRNVTPLHVEPLSDEVMASMLDALVRGMPPALRDDLAARAEGLPLFAIETIRMLIDRDQVVPRDGVYVLASPLADVGELGVPPTFQAITAARLDHLPDPVRRLVKDVAVLGLSFTLAEVQQMVTATGSLDPEEVEGLLVDLVRRDVLTMQSDVRASDAGHYRFVQKLMRTVAYETISRRDRKARHLAVAEHLGLRQDAEELSGKIAGHLLSAADAVPEDDDVTDLRRVAARHLGQAGDRNRLLAAHREALRNYQRALEHVDTDAEVARLSELAGQSAYRCGDWEAALAHATEARTIFEALGDSGGTARMAALQGDSLGALDRLDDALAALLPVQTSLGADSSPSDRAALGNAIASTYMGMGNVEDADRWLGITLKEAEAAGAWEVLARAMNVRAQTMLATGQPVMGRALLIGALELGLEHDLASRCAIQTGNLAVLGRHDDLETARRYALEGLEHARRAGSPVDEAWLTGILALIEVEAGRWDQAPVADALERGMLGGQWSRWSALIPAVLLATWQGTDEEGTTDYVTESAEDIQGRVAEHAVGALRAARGGDWSVTLGHAREAVELARSTFLSLADEFPIFWPLGVEAALELGRVEDARELVDVVGTAPLGLRSRLVGALLAVLDARVRAAEGDAGGVEEQFRDGIRRLEEIGHLAQHAKAQLDLAEWLASTDRVGDAQRAAQEAAASCARLGAKPWSERAARLLGVAEGSAVG